MQKMREILWLGGDVGLMAAIASTLALTADVVPWSGLQEGRGMGFGDALKSSCRQGRQRP